MTLGQTNFISAFVITTLMINLDITLKDTQSIRVKQNKFNINKSPANSKKEIKENF